MLPESITGCILRRCYYYHYYHYCRARINGKFTFNYEILFIRFIGIRNSGTYFPRRTLPPLPPSSSPPPPPPPSPDVSRLEPGNRRLNTQRELQKVTISIARRGRCGKLHARDKKSRPRISPRRYRCHYRFFVFFRVVAHGRNGKMKAGKQDAELIEIASITERRFRLSLALINWKVPV